MPHISLSANTRTRTHTHTHAHTHTHTIHPYTDGGRAAMQGHDLLTGSSLGTCALLKDTWTCSQEERTTVITGRPAPPPELPSSFPALQKTNDCWVTCFVRNVYHIGRQLFFFLHAFFFQALWVFINCRKNILHGESWHMAHCFASGWTVLFLKSLL